MVNASYAGDVRPAEAWSALQSDANAVLIDVRSQPEWAFVGLPDLSAAEKQPMLVQWQVFPTMQQNPQFTQQLEAAGLSSGQPLYFICRSGARSQAAAIAATAAGLGPCYNVSDGFEGGHDGERHRGKQTGWKAEGLPWVQD
jgi:rhodanese-related sulfurtransferase